jgi:hypothetical protein
MTFAIATLAIATIAGGGNPVAGPVSGINSFWKFT